MNGLLSDEWQFERKTAWRKISFRTSVWQNAEIELRIRLYTKQFSMKAMSFRLNLKYQCFLSICYICNTSGEILCETLERLVPSFLLLSSPLSSPHSFSLSHIHVQMHAPPPTHTQLIRKKMWFLSLVLLNAPCINARWDGRRWNHFDNNRSPTFPR